MRRSIILVSAMTMLSACVSSGSIGDVSRDASGPAEPSAILRALNGGLIGQANLDGIGRGDREKALEAEYRALEYAAAGSAIAWQGSGGVSGEVIAAQPYRVGSQDCRSYVHTVRAAVTSRLRGTACRNGDGSWTPLS